MADSLELLTYLERELQTTEREEREARTEAARLLTTADNHWKHGEALRVVIRNLGGHVEPREKPPALSTRAVQCRVYADEIDTLLSGSVDGLSPRDIYQEINARHGGGLKRHAVINGLRACAAERGWVKSGHGWDVRWHHAPPETKEDGHAG